MNNDDILKTITGKYGNIIIKKPRQSTENSRDDFMQFLVALSIHNETRKLQTAI